MKIIDEKGKLFGKINVIDLGILLLVLLLLGGVGYKLMGRQLQGVPAAKKDVLVTVRCTQKFETAAMAIETALATKKDTRMVSLATYVDAWVESLRSEAADYNVPTADGRLLWGKHPFLKDLYITFRMKVDVNTPMLKLGSQDVAVGKQFEFKTHTVHLFGIVDTIEVK
jgi:hypothetical protein